MGLRINTNVAAMNAYRNLSVTDGQMAKSLEKLSSGFRINRAADDAAGLAISEGLRSQVGGLKVAVRNAQDGVSVVQTAEGALTEVHSMLQRMNDLAVQYANGTQNTDSKKALEAEFNALAEEIGRIQDNTKFNGVALFGNTTSGTAGVVDFQVGYASGDKISVDLSKELAVTPAVPGTSPAVVRYDSDGDGAGDADVVISDSGTVQKAITNVSTRRGELGAIQNRFEHTINNLNVAVENLSASESRIRDTDMAQEMVEFTRSQILSQAGTAMLAQANQAPQSVLRLLQ
jgi:flagellin